MSELEKGMQELRRSHSILTLGKIEEKLADPILPGLEVRGSIKQE